MRVSKKVTSEMKVRIREMKLKGSTNAAIAKELDISTSTVSYHSSDRARQLAIKRAKRNEKARDRLEYMRSYQSKKYKTDEEFREKIKKANRENWRKKSKKTLK